jgi:Protein of unknown function (DUF2384)
MAAAQATEILEKRARETKEIISRVSEWAGGDEEAMVWYRTEPIPAFGGLTAEMLVSSGQFAAVGDDPEGIAIGGFA